MPDLRELPISTMGPFKNELVAVIFNLCLTGELVGKGLKNTDTHDTPQAS